MKPKEALPKQAVHRSTHCRELVEIPLKLRESNATPTNRTIFPPHSLESVLVALTLSEPWGDQLQPLQVLANECFHSSVWTMDNFISRKGLP